MLVKGFNRVFEGDRKTDNINGEFFAHFEDAGVNYII